MRPRIVFCAVALICTAWTGTSSQAQEADNLQSQIDNLRTEIKSLGEGSATKEELQQKVDLLLEGIQANNGLIKNLQNDLKDVDSELLKTKEELQNAVDQIREQANEITEIVRAISREDASPGQKWVVDLRANMRSNSFRQELQQSVNEVIPETGTLQVSNEMDSGYFLYVNRREEWIPARSTKTFTVPTGTLTTELRGFEQPKNWTIGPPNYSQQVIIAPQQQSVTAARPVQANGGMQNMQSTSTTVLSPVQSSTTVLSPAVSTVHVAASPVVAAPTSTVMYSPTSNVVYYPTSFWWWP